MWRYLGPLVVVPTLALTSMFFMLISIRAVGICIVSFNGIPSDVSLLQQYCGAASTRSTVFIFLSQIFAFGGPVFIYMFFFPFYLAFPEELSLKKKRNILLFGAGLIFQLIMVGVVLSIPTSYRKLTLGILRACLICYWMIIVPLIIKRKLTDRNRNPFLIQMEHDRVCCDTKLDFRHSRCTKIELILYSSVIWMMISVLVYVFAEIDLTLLVLIPLALLVYVLFTERNLHFYGDFSYTYLLAIFPHIFIEIGILVFRTMLNLMLTNESGPQLAVIAVFSGFMLASVRIVLGWSSNSVNIQRYAIINLFPIRILEDTFQFLFLYTMRKIESPTFWLALILVLMTNILDTTGVLTDLYDKMISKLRISTSFRRRDPELFPFPTFTLKSSENRQAERQNFLKHLLKVINDALDLIHQQCFCMLIVCATLIFMWLLDLFIDSFIDLETICSVRCSFLGTFRGWKFAISKQSIILIQYLLVVLVATIVWTFRLRNISWKYPIIKNYIVGFLDDSEEYELQNLDKNNRTNQDVDRIKVLNGEFSSWWGDYRNILFIEASLLYGIWALLVNSVDKIRYTNSV